MKSELIILSDGTKEWRLFNGNYHKEDGPAVEFTDGSKLYIQYGKYHREDGPALNGPNGDKYWFYHGKQIKCKDNEEFLKLIKLKALW